MGWRGRHSRSYIWLSGMGEYYVEKEIESVNYGIFGIVERYDDEYYVIWRPNRNCTTDWKVVVMYREYESSYSSIMGREEIIYKSMDEAVAAIENHWQTEFKYPEKTKRYRPRDAQKSKVYRWEHIMAQDLGVKEQITALSTLNTLNQRREKKWLRNFLKHMCAELGEKDVELKFRSGGNYSTGSSYRIRLLPNHCTQLILIHEFAHTLHSSTRWGNETDGKRHQSHGQEFVGVYMYLLIRFAGVDKDALFRHATEHKIKFLLPQQFWEWEDKQEAA